MSQFTLILKQVTKEKKDVLLSILVGFIAGIAAIGLFSASGYLLSKAAIGVPLATLTAIIALVKLLGVTRAFSRYGERYYSHRASFTVLGHIRKTFYKKLDRSFSLLKRNYQSGDLLSRMIGDIESLQTYFLRVLYPPVLLALLFFSTIFFAAFFSVTIAGLLLLGFILQIIVLPAFFYWRLQKNKSDVRQHRSSFSSNIAEYLFGYKDLLIFQQEKDKRDQLMQLSETYEQTSFQQSKQEKLHQTLFTGVGYLTTWLVIGISAYFVSAGELDGLYLAMFLLLTLTVFEHSEIMGSFPTHLANSQEVGERLSVLETNHQETKQKSVQAFEKLTLNGVTFNYPSAISPTIVKMNLELPKGSKTAIVGPSGSGKSTIIDLILGIEQPTSGQLNWNDQPIAAIDPSSLWDVSNVVLQENHYFYGTIRENLFADGKVTNDEIQAALNRVNLHQFTADSHVAEKGSNLSGGEKQRLSIARTFLRKADLWLLDEPTSSLDEKNKHQVYEELFKETAGQTVLLITHELSHLETMDQIVVLQEGSIAEVGTFDELMMQKGYFYQLKQIEDSVIR